MARPVTLFTGQWADLSLEVICEKASRWGYDGIELPCWGDHFNVQTAKWWLDRQDRLAFHAQRAAEYRNTKRVVITETRKDTRLVSMEVTSKH